MELLGLLLAVKVEAREGAQTTRPVGLDQRRATEDEHPKVEIGEAHGGSDLVSARCLDKLCESAGHGIASLGVDETDEEAKDEVPLIENLAVAQRERERENECLCLSYERSSPSTRAVVINFDVRSGSSQKCQEQHGSQRPWQRRFSQARGAASLGCSHRCSPSRAGRGRQAIELGCL